MLSLDDLCLEFLAHLISEIANLRFELALQLIPWHALHMCELRLVRDRPHYRETLAVTEVLRNRLSNFVLAADFSRVAICFREAFLKVFPWRTPFEVVVEVTQNPEKLGEIVLEVLVVFLLVDADMTA